MFSMKKLAIIIISLVAFVQLSHAQKKKAVRKPATKATTTKKKTVVPAAAAQRREPVADTTKPNTVVVTSAFKPSLQTAAKINFSAASPAPDSTRPSLEYNVPAQNLIFTFQPTPLQPLAANIDTAIHWENKNYVKAGFGNYSTPYFQAGLSLGDGETSVVNVHAKHISSKGSLPFQQYSKSNLEVIGIFNPNETIEWGGKVYFDNSNQYLYGYQPDSLKFSKDDLRQRFTSFGAKVGLRNKQENAFGISYSPNLSYSVFADNRSAMENNLVLNAPISKSFGKIFAFNLGVTADLTNYKTDQYGAINNNLFYLAPALQFKTPNFKLIAGITPSWDNSVFEVLPDITAEAKINEEKFIIQAGWVGYFNKTTYQSLAGINPWLAQPSFLLNTRIREQYAGFKGSAGSHITYNARVSYLNFSNQPLFVNDTITGRSFDIVNESGMKAIRIHGELGYTIQENFSLLGGITFNQYSDLKDNEKAWGLLPLEINGGLRWNLFKDFMLKSDVFFWDGAQYRNKSLSSQKLKPAFDLNAGIEFKVLPKFDLWLQFNNLFNNKYQRWNQYEVLGFNVLGGIVYSFGEK